MQWYKANLNGVITRDTNDPNVKSGAIVAHFIKKGELILVKSVEELVDKNLSFPYFIYCFF